MKVAYIIPIMKKVDKKYRFAYIFFIFALPLILTEFLKTYKIMKNLKRKPKNFTDLLLGRIESQIHFAKEDYVSFADNLSAINESLHHYQIALDDAKDLVKHLEKVIYMLEELKPLPF